MISIRKILDVVKVAGRTYDTGRLTLPSVDTSDAYTAGDAVGIQFEVKLPFTQAVLHSATLYDIDDEGIQLDIIISEQHWVSEVADDAAMSPGDPELESILEVLQFSSFDDFNNGQISRLRNIGLALDLPGKSIFLQGETQGTPTYAAAKVPQVRLTFLVDS